jgi:hypothetical protein
MEKAQISCLIGNGNIAKKNTNRRDNEERKGEKGEERKKLHSSSPKSPRKEMENPREKR